jgi:hypothetical protein
MGTPAKEPRCHQICVRFTDKEFILLKGSMASLDYTSTARYIRDRVLGRQILIRKDVVLSDRNLRNQINSLSSIVARIGVDYNQATKKFNTLLKMKRADGSPVINARAANYYLTQLNLQTRELITAVDHVIDVVDRLDYDNTKPRKGEI